MRTLLVGIGLLLALALPARAANDFGPERPYGLLKVGLGLPGLPGYAAEIFLSDAWTLELEGGNGLIGGYGLVGGRWRPCWGCDDGAGFALGLGPELAFIPYGDHGRTAIYAAVAIAPAFVYRVSSHFGLTTGLKVSTGSGIEWETQDDGTRRFIDPELINLFMLYVGVQI